MNMLFLSGLLVLFMRLSTGDACADIDPVGCQANPNLCSNPVLAVATCPVSCKKCPTSAPIPMTSAPITTTAPIATHATVETECVRGWVQHGSSCYLISHDQQYWHSSEKLCELLGGYLAEIQNSDENTFIQQLVDSLQRNVWVGGTDLLQEGKWVWMASNEPVAYSNWEPGEPNSYQNSDENCIDIRPGYTGWNDERCVTLQNYICENSEREGTAVIG